VSERQTAHLEPLGGRRHVLLNASVVASVRVMYNPAKRWVKQNVVNCWLGEQGERVLFLRRAAAGGCAGAPNSKDEKSPDNCRPRQPRRVLSDLRSESLPTIQTDLCWARTARDLWNSVVLVLDFRNAPVRDRA